MISRHSPSSWPVENFFLSQRGQNLLQAIFYIVGKVILCRIIVQVAPLIPAWGKKLHTKIR